MSNEHIPAKTRLQIAKERKAERRAARANEPPQPEQPKQEASYRFIIPLRLCDCIIELSVPPSRG